ncbi:hypothetical protein Tco_1518722 [Tanacetum coccineum]
MVAHIISISFDTSKESVGSSISRVVLFGMIPIVIPDDASTMVHVTIPPVIHDSAAKIPIIPPKRIHLHQSMHPLHQLLLHFYVLLILPRHLDTSSSSSSTHALPSTVIASPALYRIIPAPPGVPRRPAILVLPGQDIPFGRPYRTQPNGGT